MLVLQTCTDSPHILPGSSSETFLSSSDGTYDVSHTAVEGDVVVIEESLIAIHKEEDIGIKQEEIPEDMKSIPDEVSYVCICLLSHTFYHCP
jgi:hypothetical protein